MIEKKGPVIQFPGSITSSTNKNSVEVTRIKSIHIEPSNPAGDQKQWGVVTTAFANAPEMSFEVLYREAGKRGDKATKVEVDAPLNASWKNKASEVIEQDGNFVAWKNTGEQIIVQHRLPSSEYTQALNKSPIPTNIISNIEQPAQSKTLSVVEVFGVTSPQNQPIPSETDYDLQRQNNQYLKSPVDIQSIPETKKAA